MPELAVPHLLFETAHGTWALPQAQAQEVFELSSVRALPGAPAHVRGLAVVRGELVTLVDLDVLRGQPVDALPGRAVLVRTPRGALGLISLRVLGLEPVPVAPAVAAEGLGRLLRGPVVVADRAVLALDGDGLGAWLETIC